MLVLFITYQQEIVMSSLDQKAVDVNPDVTFVLVKPDGMPHLHNIKERIVGAGQTTQRLCAIAE